MVEGKTWESPMAFKAQDMADLVHKVLDRLGYKYERETGKKHYTKLYVIMPTPQYAYVFRYLISEPIELKIDLYDTQPTHASLMPFIEIEGITDDNINQVRAILNELRKDLPRDPWLFTMGQKFQHGFLMPEFRRARKAWTILLDLPKK